ncbi:phosphonate ABC transporter ATP-binding protein [Salinadaptatus halalkaliphilus]|uniref:Phosphonate ABC transporter ATP-binding protein n=1 Tax=Salinadaptatus halalkaliphilus TaxID=2419781 RepID=A0A4S3TT81_9EURY|nr:phosphonate ABC transporter ATP-binding protein [Salinadaptatus halalkaliphilus]THE66633.1 phosphonate ABC transporter ATP-binding protein [Salinadaptatus halalkaliphilus]
MSRIAVTNLTKVYGDDTIALDDVSFEIDEGEFVIVLGVSGSGKSTLLRCLSSLTSPTEGTIEIDGDEVTQTHDDIAMIFQQHNIIGQMTAYSNALSGSLSRSDFVESVFQLQDSAEKYRALEALETVGLLEEAQSKARNMSGGQQQRVGIARALVQEPRVMLADEPVASLDPGSSQQVMQYLLEASVDRDLTTMISLHEVNLARKFGERFIGLRDGKKVFDGYSEDFTIDIIDEIYGDIDIDGIVAEDGADTNETETGKRATKGGSAV